MADNHRALRAPRWLWQEAYADTVGDVGRTADLKTYMDWQIDNPGATLGEDVDPPHDFLATFRIEQERWDAFRDSVPAGTSQARIRAYIWWRTNNPDAPLPGRRLPPIRRQSQVAVPV